MLLHVSDPITNNYSKLLKLD